jgi:hypothetical protein
MINRAGGVGIFADSADLLKLELSNRRVI